MEKTTTTTLPYLPHELIIQILLKLPVKFLLRFKCVCKSWFSLISDFHFAKSHFELTATTHTRRILSISHSPPQIRSIDFESSHNSASVVNLNNILIPHSVQIKGSCRGFILMRSSSSLYLWNPSTGLRKQIPLSPFVSKLKKNILSTHHYGFGYDQSTDDYLVVVLCNDNNVSSHLEFFSLRDNTWKQIEIDGTRFPYMGSTGGQGVLFNGAIHWLAFRNDLSVFVIVAFDLMERNIFEVPLPDRDFHYDYLHCHLWVFGEFISLLLKDHENYTTKIWVMKEYKVRSSWTKTLVLPCCYISPIYSTKNYDIIGMMAINLLVKYNDKGRLLGNHHDYCKDRQSSQVIMYTESLLSLPGDNEQV